MDKISKRNWIYLFVILVITILITVILFKNSIIKTDKIQKLGSDFQYNIISTSSIIGGFLFTAVSILLSTLSIERIKRLWKHNYLDNLYRYSFTGIIANIISIISAIVLLCFTIDDSIIKYVIEIEITSLITGVVFFVCCMFKLFRLVKKLKAE